jgi:hypothetical protein
MRFRKLPSLIVLPCSERQREGRDGRARGLELGDELEPEARALDEGRGGGEHARRAGDHGEEEEHEAAVVVLCGSQHSMTLPGWSA